jgi:hypothetical protein
MEEAGGVGVAAVPRAPAAARVGGERSAGPLLLFPDTSALLPMLEAGGGVALPTWLTLGLLGGLARQARFGRALAPGEQVFLVVTDSVLKQLVSWQPAGGPGCTGGCVHGWEQWCASG